MKTVDKKNVIKIKAELYSDYKHIYMLNGLSIPEDYTLYKYMPYKRLVGSVKNKELVFVSPKTWVDPFERRFWKTDYSKRYNGFIQPEIACMCLTTKSSTNEEAAWKMYADDTDKALRISIRKKQLFDNLENYAISNNCKVYVGKAIYEYDRTTIVGLHNHINEFFPKSPNEFSLAHYLTLMCLKRKSFAFENEIRLFIVKEKLDWVGDLIKVSMEINKDLVPRVTIGPLKPFTNDDPRKGLYNIIQNTEKEVYKNKLTTTITNCNVTQSQLYTDKKPLTRI